MDIEKNRIFILHFFMLFFFSTYLVGQNRVDEKSNVPIECLKQEAIYSLYHDDIEWSIRWRQERTFCRVIDCSRTRCLVPVKYSCYAGIVSGTPAKCSTKNEIDYNAKLMWVAERKRKEKHGWWIWWDCWTHQLWGL